MDFYFKIKIQIKANKNTNTSINHMLNLNRVFCKMMTITNLKLFFKHVKNPADSDLKTFMYVRKHLDERYVRS